MLYFKSEPFWTKLARVAQWRNLMKLKESNVNVRGKDLRWVLPRQEVKGNLIRTICHLRWTIFRSKSICLWIYVVSLFISGGILFTTERAHILVGNSWGQSWITVVFPPKFITLPESQNVTSFGNRVIETKMRSYWSRMRL